MGRTIFVDEHVQTSIQELITTGRWFTGVIIGQVSTQRDSVIHIAPTPDPVEDEALEENEDGEASTESIPTQKINRPSTLQELDEKWVTTHAKQVLRMLPGGLSVIGLFAVAPTSQLQASQIKLKQMMFSVHKGLSKSQVELEKEEIMDRIILQVDSTNRKLTCTTLNVADGKSTPRPAEWKYQTSRSKWTALHSRVDIDVTMSIEKSSRNQSSLHKQLQGGLSSFCESVKQSPVSFDGVFRDDSDMLVDSPVESKGGRGRKVDSRGDGGHDANKPITAGIYLPFANSPNDHRPAPEIFQSVAVLRICGAFCVRGFVPAKSTVADAVKALRMDITRSVYARCELLCEEDNVTEDGESSSVYNPPIRYFFPSPNGGVSFCDYAFEDEKEEEMKERIKELLSVPAEQLENVEKHATLEDISMINPSVPEVVEGELARKDVDGEKARTVKMYILALVAALMAVSIIVLFGSYQGL